jgi:iron complex outermembrane receptor protein
MKKITNLLTTGGVVVIGCVAAGNALAQTAPADGTAVAQTTAADPSAPKQDNAIQEVVITAERTAGVPSKTPIALSVVSGEALKEHGVVNVSDLQNIVPDLVVGNEGHGPNISIRGVTTTDVTSKGEQGVAFNIDGIPVSRPEIMGNAFFDLERVEVLRGPQGTLYGKSSTGGAINVVTAKPQDEFDASASVDIGNYNTHRTEAMINVPVNDSFALRAAASVNYRDGYITESIDKTSSLIAPKLDDENNRTGRVSGLWKMSKDASLLVTGTFGHVGGSGPGGVLYSSFQTEGSSAARQVYFNPYAPAADDNFNGVNAEFNMNLGAVHLTYDGGHSNFKAHDITGMSEIGADANNGQFSWQDYYANITNDSHEIRFSNAKPQRLEWVAGANFYRELNDEKDNNWASTATCAPSLSSDCNTPNPSIIGPTQHEGKSIFGQGNFHATDALKYTLGLRYSDDSMYRRATIVVGPGHTDTSGNPCAPGTVACVGGGAVTDDNGSQAAKRLTWRVGADYQLAPRQMVYGYVATGYKGGGFNDLDPHTGKPASYDPEKLVAYEIGYKGQLTPTLQYNSSLYYYDYKSYQVTSSAFFGFGATGPLILIYTQSAPAHMAGWENELNWKATPNDKLSFSLAFERARYGDLAVGFLVHNPVDFSGKSLDNAPPVSGTFAYEHRWELAAGGDLSLRFNSRYESGYYKSDLGGQGDLGSNTYTRLPAQYRQDAFTRSDLSLIYAAASGKYELQAYVRNLENKLQMTSLVPANGPNFGNTIVDVNAPRTFGIRMAMHY